MLSEFRIPLAATIVAAAFFCSSARALESPWSEASHSETRLIADSANGRLRAGVELRLESGWKTYWRYPGDSGVPPRFDWSGSENLGSIEIQWPAPQRFVDDSGMKSIGYHDRVLFPLLVTAADPSQPIKLRLKVDYAVCEKLCVPANAETSLDIPPDLAELSELLEQASVSVPRRVPPGENGGLAISKVRIERGEKPRAIIEVSVPQDATAQLFAEGPDDKWALPLPEKIDPENGRARFSLNFDGAPPGAPPIPPKLLLTLVTDGDAIEVEIPLEGTSEVR